jgi:hypothetical protein
MINMGRIQKHYEKKFRNPKYLKKYETKQNIKRIKKMNKNVRKGRSTALQRHW